jgi:hypothetical protein
MDKLSKIIKAIGKLMEGVGCLLDSSDIEQNETKSLNKENSYSSHYQKELDISDIISATALKKTPIRSKISKKPM